jgi:Ribbon-helix-helix protein, copG family.
MVSKSTAVRISFSSINFLKKMKKYRETYDLIINKLIDQCVQVIDQVEEDIYEPYEIFVIKMTDGTKERLDEIANEKRMTRSEVLRKLIQSKAKGLC